MRKLSWLQRMACCGRVASRCTCVYKYRIYVGIDINASVQLPVHFGCVPKQLRHRNKMALAHPAATTLSAAALGTSIICLTTALRFLILLLLVTANSPRLLLLFLLPIYLWQHGLHH